MENKKMKAFDLPKMKIEEITDTGQLMGKIERAKLHFAIVQEENDDLNCLMSEPNEELFIAVMAVFHRNVFVHDFVKLAYLVIEKFRNGKMEEAKEFMQQSIKYIKSKKSL
jgi:hypothetical protein